jgi:hypothetical protein
MSEVVGQLARDSLGLAGVTGDSYPLVEMQSGAVANNLSFVEDDSPARTRLNSVRARVATASRRRRYRR